MLEQVTFVIAKIRLSVLCNITWKNRIFLCKENTVTVKSIGLMKSLWDNTLIVGHNL